MIYNTTTVDVEVWTGSAWKPFLGQGLRNWTDATRPSSPQVGDIGYNTEQEVVEVYDGTDWVPVGSGGSADPGEYYYTSTGTHTFIVPDGVKSISYVAVGAGGGGSYNEAGGGAGGALAYRNNVTVSLGDSITVRVGSGGGAANNNGQPGQGGGQSYVQVAGTQTIGGGGSGATGGWA